MKDFASTLIIPAAFALALLSPDAEAIGDESCSPVAVQTSIDDYFQAQSSEPLADEVILSGESSHPGLQDLERVLHAYMHISNCTSQALRSGDTLTYGRYLDSLKEAQRGISEKDEIRNQAFLELLESLQIVWSDHFVSHFGHLLQEKTSQDRYVYLAVGTTFMAVTAVFVKRIRTKLSKFLRIVRSPRFLRVFGNPRTGAVLAGPTTRNRGKKSSLKQGGADSWQIVISPLEYMEEKPLAELPPEDLHLEELEHEWDIVVGDLISTATSISTGVGVGLLANMAAERAGLRYSSLKRALVRNQVVRGKIAQAKSLSQALDLLEERRHARKLLGRAQGKATSSRLLNKVFRLGLRLTKLTSLIGMVSGIGTEIAMNGAMSRVRLERVRGVYRDSYTRLAELFSDPRAGGEFTLDQASDIHYQIEKLRSYFSYRLIDLNQKILRATETYYESTHEPAVCHALRKDFAPAGLGFTTQVSVNAAQRRFAANVANFFRREERLIETLKGELSQVRELFSLDDPMHGLFISRLNLFATWLDVSFQPDRIAEGLAGAIDAGTRESLALIKNKSLSVKELEELDNANRCDRWTR